MMKVLIVGFGSIGKKHALLLKARYPEFKLIICSRHFKAENDKAFNIDYLVSNLEEAVGLAPDAAIIANEPAKHLETAIFLAKKGIHLFIEKPLSHEMMGIELLLKLVQEKKIILTVGYVYRFSKSLNQFKMRILSGDIGKIYILHAHVGQHLSDWRTDIPYHTSCSARKELGGGVALELSHELDYLSWIFGYPTLVASSAEKVSELKIDVEDAVNMLLIFPHFQFSSKIMGHVHLNMLERPASRYCKVIGTAGTLVWDAIKDSVTLFSQASNFEPVTIYQGQDQDRKEMYLSQLEHFFSAIEEKTAPAVNLTHAAKILSLSLAAQKSLLVH